MSEYRELRTISLDFRRISSNLLSSDDGDADVNLHRLMDYIEKTPFIHDRVHSVVDQVEYDFQACFPTHSSEWASTSIPVDENCHIKAIYDYMRYIVETPNTNVLGQAMQYLFTIFPGTIKEITGIALINYTRLCGPPYGGNKPMGRYDLSVSKPISSRYGSICFCTPHRSRQLVPASSLKIRRWSVNLQSWNGRK